LKKFRRVTMEAQKPTYCMECKYFEHTKMTHDGKRYELGGKCHNADHNSHCSNYRNGGCDACTLYEKADDGRMIPNWMVK
jgi:hypothetical protein